MTRAVARVDAVTLEARASVSARRSNKSEAKRAGIDLALTPGKVRAVCARALRPGLGAPSSAAVCTYPALVPAAAGVGSPTK